MKIRYSLSFGLFSQSFFVVIEVGVIYQKMMADVEVRVKFFLVFMTSLCLLVYPFST